MLQLLKSNYIFHIKYSIIFQQVNVNNYFLKRIQKVVFLFGSEFFTNILPAW
jgi:hypothetical protein